MAAIKSLGVTLVKTKSGSESTNTTIADLTSIGEFGIESDEIDVTTLDSTGGYKEFIAGFKDAGEISLAGIVKTESAFTAMTTLAGSQAIEQWTLTFTSGSKWIFNGFVKSFKEGESSIDGVRNFTGSIRISGEPVFTAAKVSA